METKTFKCIICDSSFAHKRHFKVHVESVHEGKKPFKCAICDADFTAKQSLKLHISSIHEDNKPFKCSSCILSFSQKCNLARHIESVHEKEKPFVMQHLEKIKLEHSEDNFVGVHETKNEMFEKIVESDIKSEST